MGIIVECKDGHYGGMQRRVSWSKAKIGIMVGIMMECKGGHNDNANVGIMVECKVEHNYSLRQRFEHFIGTFQKVKTRRE